MAEPSSCSSPVSWGRCEIDTTEPVLVTGATGYLAGVLIRDMLDAGVKVHAAVRPRCSPTAVEDIDKAKTKTDPVASSDGSDAKSNVGEDGSERLRYLQDVADRSEKGTIRFFDCNLLEDGSFDDAMRGCSVVFHTASPFLSGNGGGDPYRDLIGPAVVGTQNVLRTACRTRSVRRIVLTSSAAAVASDMCEAYRKANKASSSPSGALKEVKTLMLNENDWNRTASVDYQPYKLSKTLAEQAAWVIAGGQTQWTLVCMNPSLILGPGLKYHPSSVSNQILRKMGDNGRFQSGHVDVLSRLGYCSDYRFGVVDVRDVARAHVVAAYNHDISGRYLLVGHHSGIMDVANVLSKRYPVAKYPMIPTQKIPKLFLLLSASLSSLLSPSSSSTRLVWNNVSVTPRYDTTKSISELGVVYRPLEETIHDMFQLLIEENIVSA